MEENAIVVIAREDFEFRKRINVPYKGYVEGLGYVIPRSVAVRVSKSPYFNICSVQNNIIYTVIPLPPAVIPPLRSNSRNGAYANPNGERQQARSDKETTVGTAYETFAEQQEQLAQVMNWRYNGDRMRGQIVAHNMLYNTLPKLNFLTGTGLSLTETAGHSKIGSTLSLSVSNVNKLFKIGNIMTLVFGVILDESAYSAGRISGKKFALNSGVSFFAAGVGYISSFLGVAISARYYSIDLFYPGGWGGYGRDMKEQEKDNPLDYIHKKY